MRHILHNGGLTPISVAIPISVVCMIVEPIIIEPRREKTVFLHMRKQRRRSASR